MNLKDIKTRRYDNHERFIIHGRTHTGKTKLLQYLMPEKYILHSEENIRRKESTLSLSNIDNHPVIGIDECHYLNVNSLRDCISYVRQNRKGLVIVCQEIDDIPDHHGFLMEATYINTNNMDLREAKELIYRTELKIVSAEI